MDQQNHSNRFIPYSRFKILVHRANHSHIVKAESELETSSIALKTSHSTRRFRSNSEDRVAKSTIQKIKKNQTHTHTQNQNKIYEQFKCAIDSVFSDFDSDSIYLAIGGSVFFDGPTSFSTESLEDLVVVAVLRQVVVPLSSESSIDLRRYGSPPPLSPPVVLPLPPRRLPPARRRRCRSVRSHFLRRRYGGASS